MSLMQPSLRRLNTVSPIDGRDAFGAAEDESPFDKDRDDHSGIGHDLFELSKQVEQMELLKSKLSSTISHIDSVVREVDALRRENHGLQEACERERRKTAEGLNQIHRLELKLATFNDMKADYAALSEETTKVRSEHAQCAPPY